MSAQEDAPMRKGSLVAVVAALGLIVMMAALVAFAGPVMKEFNATALQTLDRVGYVRAVLGSDVTASFASNRPGSSP